MKILLARLSLFSILLLFAVPFGHAEDVSTEDLQQNINYLFPSTAYLSGFEHHSTWREIERSFMTETSGIEVTYEAIFDESPQWTDELPTINMYLIATSSQKAAKTQFEAWANSYAFTSGTWEKLSEGKDYFAYYAGIGSDNDLIKYRPLEEGSLHVVSYYDDVLMVVNLYRPAGDYLSNNVNAYLEYLNDDEETISILNELIVYAEEALKFYLEATFSIEGPSDYDYRFEAASDSISLSDLMEVPQNGIIAFEVYLDDASESGGVVMMESGAADIPGTFQLMLKSNGHIEARFFDDRVNSNCHVGDGWHQLSGKTTLRLYEWQSVELTYGAEEQFNLFVNGDLDASCDLATERADQSIFLGNAPEESGENIGFVGYLKNVETIFSLNEQGLRLDDLLIFNDVSISHPNADAIQYMKETGIIEGYSDGTFKPENPVNRAEILKMLLLGLGYKVPGDYKTVPFTDLSSGVWYLPYVNYAVQLGIVKGYDDGTYRPASSMNRVEFLKVLLITYGLNLNDYPVTSLYPDTDKKAWYAPYVQYSKDQGLMDTDLNGNFNPANPVTRAEVAETIYRLMEGS